MRLKPTPEHVEVVGTYGVDFDVPVNGQPPQMSSMVQMNTAMRLPVGVAGALMPDAHPSAASLPVGGVALLENAISPKMVGPDISCSMRFTPLQGVSVADARKYQQAFLTAIVHGTHFGPGAAIFADGRIREHAIMDDSAWGDLPQALSQKSPAWPKSANPTSLKEIAQSQLDSSGSGNHFVDLVVATSRQEKTAVWPFAMGEEFVALISHSGSRGAGYKLAKYYGRLSSTETSHVATGIPQGYEWLSMSGAAGQEYFYFMKLLGRYAEANHQLIHEHFLTNSGLCPIRNSDGSIYHIYNRHNYAWEDGNGRYLHRKGATPAESGSLGVIPGSCASPLYIVQGLGNAATLNSASHGAGRVGSRTAAKAACDIAAVQAEWERLGIVMHGVATDETHKAYKDIRRIIKLQEGTLVDVLAEAMPVTVVMGGKS